MMCTRARELIVELDRREAPGRALADHLRGCDECHEYYRRLQRLEADAAPGPENASPAANETGQPSTGFTARVMRAVVAEAEASRATAPTDASTRRPVGLRGWTVGGTVIVAGLIAIEFSDVVEWLRGAFGSVIDVALSTMLGVALTIYILLLVGLNLRAVRRFLRPRIR